MHTTPCPVATTFRVVVFALVRGLKDRGKPTKLVFYPREGHGISEYYQHKDRLQRIYAWVTKYTLGAADKTIEQ